MKLRHPCLIRAAGIAGSWLLRLWNWTVPFDCRALGPDVHPRRVPAGQHFLYAFWHEYLLLPAAHYGHANIRILSSRHADGQLITDICDRLGFSSVRGSTSRGGVEAMRELLRAGQDSHLAITPDGPRGPRRVVQPGVVYLASRAGLPLVPVGFGMRNPWRARSWDRMALPRPGRPATCVLGEPRWIPPQAGRGELEYYRGLVEADLHEVTGLAERWADGGPAPEATRVESQRRAA
jgi:lysophospholipid acyltransferase (LPLAT)-like uncharacterized protein